MGTQKTKKRPRTHYLPSERCEAFVRSSQPLGPQQRCTRRKTKTGGDYCAQHAGRGKAKDFPYPLVQVPITEAPMDGLYAKHPVDRLIAGPAPHWPVHEETIVTFFSPGTMFAETSSREIEAADPVLAMALLNKKPIVERHGRPYGFQFERVVTAKSVPDGRGGYLSVQAKTLWTSGMYFIEGKVFSYDEIVARADPNEATLRSNMHMSILPYVVETVNVYRSTKPFTEKDFVVDKDGNILVRGDEERFAGYRKQFAENVKAEIAAFSAKLDRGTGPLRSTRR